MSTTQTQTRHASLPILDRLMGQFARFGQALSQFRARRIVYKRTYGELIGLSDRELGDIGIHRADIHRVAALQARKGTAQ